MGLISIFRKNKLKITLAKNHSVSEKWWGDVGIVML